MRLASSALVLAALLLASGCGGTDEHGSDATVRREARADRGSATHQSPVDRLSLRQQVGETIVLSFAGSRAPGYVRRVLREGEVAGVILFGQNVVGPDELRRLTRTLQRAAHDAALIAVDQEGGDVRIVPFAAPELPQSAQATPAQARAAATAAARDLRRVGVNVNLAPVLDVASGSEAALAGRVFPGGPAEVATIGRAAVRAYERGGVAATAKHFPGFGAAMANTDDEPVTIDRSRGELHAEDLDPFRAAIRSGVPLVMVSHALYPALDPDRIASQSPAILDGLLRRRLGFRGVIVTDSLEAHAVLARSSLQVAARRSLLAGADILLLTGPGSYRPTYDALLAAARRSPALRARVRDAAAHTLALKRKMGLR